MNNESRRHFDVIIAGGGHNGLVAAGYLAKAGLNVAVLEQRDILGGPVGTFEFLPGYRTSFSNSPGSLDPGIVEDLSLKDHGLQFLRPDPTLVHHFPDGAFIGWRNREAVAAQLDAFAPGEAQRYNQLLRDLEVLAGKLGISIYSPERNLDQAREKLSDADRVLFDKAFKGSLRALLDEKLQSTEAKALLGMVALNTTLAHPDDPGTAVGLMMRPISMASTPPADENDLRRSALRGSTGLPVGGMGALIDALERSCRSEGVVIQREWKVEHISRAAERLEVINSDGQIYTAKKVIGTMNPQTLLKMIDDTDVPDRMRDEIDALPMTGSACKLAIALDGLPTYRGLPAGLSNKQGASTQMRICPSIDYMASQIEAVRIGEFPEAPLIWGLIPSVTSPGMAPEGKHLLSANVWHAPYKLAKGDWESRKQEFADLAISTIADLMPNIRNHIVDIRVMPPPEIEAELGLVGSHITHGDMVTSTLFGPRPHAMADDYRTPVEGLYISGSGTWPGGYVTGLPGRNASMTVLKDMNKQAAKDIPWSFS